MPFGFLKRRKTEGAAPPTSGAGSPAPAAATGVAGAASGAGTPAAGVAGSRTGTARGVAFTALTEDWRLRGRMQISGRLSDALNRREAIPITDVSWGAPDAEVLEAAPGLKSVDPYDLILVTSGEDSLPPLTDTERAALRVHKVPYDVALEVPPFNIVGTVFLHPGTEPERLLERSSEMFVAVTDPVAKLEDVEVTDPEVDVILVNRYYLRGVAQVDKRTGRPHPQMPGATPNGAG